MNVKSLLEDRGITQEHAAALAGAVESGYMALSKLFSETPMLGQFWPGIRNTGSLRNLAVQFALDNMAASTELFYVEFRPNAARNFLFLQLLVGQVIITPNYCGHRGDRSIRKAVVRGHLADRNGDLFELENDEPDVFAKGAYVQLMHGGVLKPELAMLNIPNRDQTNYSLAPWVLPLRGAEKEAVEKITDQLASRWKKRKEKFIANAS